MPFGSWMLVTGLLLLAAAVSIWPGAGAVARVRLRRLSVPEDGGSEPATGAATHRVRMLLFAGLAGFAVLVTFPSVGGALAAMATSAAVHVILPGPTAGDRSRSRLGRLSPAIRSLRRQIGGGTADPTLPFAIDLVAVCLRGGMSTSGALRDVAEVMPRAPAAPRATSSAGAVPHVSLVLGRVGAASELGSEPATAWREWVGHPAYGPLARALIVTGESGSAVADRLDSVSKQLRDAAGHQAIARAQRVGVALMAPLGLCFLPAFVCLGVVPVVVGIAGQVFR